MTPTLRRLTGTTLTALCAAAVCVSPPSVVRADDGAEAGIQVTRVEGAVTEGRAIAGLSATALELAQADGKISVPLDDVISIDFGRAPDGPRDRVLGEVALDLWNGDRLIGVIKSGDDDSVALQSPLLGDVDVPLDAIAGIDVLVRLDGSVERPPLAESMGDDEASDHVFLVGGDRVDCTIISLDPGAIVCATEASDSLRLPLARVVAVRLAKLVDNPPTGRLFTTALRDGSRVVGPIPTLDDARVLSFKGSAGYTARARLADVVAVLVRGDRFAYLADLPRPEIDVQPFWAPVAGDPNKLYAPRWDRAFSDAPLTVGGRTWLKGIGVYSGTTLTWQLDGDYAELRTAIGIDDAAGALGGAVFEVLVDGKVKWSSGFVRSTLSRSDHGKTGPVDAGRISVAGAKTLALRVLAGDAEDPYPIQDHANWLGALLVRAR